MKYLIIMLIIATFVFAVEVIPRDEQGNSDNSSKPTVEVVNTKKPDLDQNKKINNERQDRFQDTDSNSINDQREDDFQMIKFLNSKFKNLFDNHKKEEPKKSSPTKK